VHGRGEFRTVFLWGNLRERDHFEFLSVDGKIILKWNFRKYYEDVEWIDVAHVKNKWRAFVNTVINSHVP
jgi:hypothetical protein